MKIHFIAGLPRSGSTLLSAILNQNPRFWAGMTSPVLGLFNALQPKFSGSEFASRFDDSRKRNILCGVMESYYHWPIPFEDAVHTVFDTNRMWPSKLDLIHELYPAAKIICMVRNIGWIVDSMERLVAKHPLQLASMFKFQPGGTVYSRVKLMMDPEDGLIGAPLAALKQAWYGPHRDKLIPVHYDQLTRSPYATLSKIYKALDEPWHEHDTEHFSYSAQDHDEAVGIPDLHKVKGPIRYQVRKPIVPPDIFTESAALDLWPLFAHDATKTSPSGEIASQ